MAVTIESFVHPATVGALLALKNSIMMIDLTLARPAATLT
jgi:hypothetical protein